VQHIGENKRHVSQPRTMTIMNQLTTTAIVLMRTNYGEADRILTVLTPEYGKLRLMAKGVRKIKSKLAGGIELFSVSNIGFIRGRGEISTLVSARLLRHYGHIVSDLARVQLGYDLIKLLNKITEDNSEAEYFAMLEQAFQSLDDVTIGEQLIRVWFSAQLLRLGGHMPNLGTDAAGQKLRADMRYDFDFTAILFVSRDEGRFTADHIKFLRLLFSGIPPHSLQKVQSSAELVAQTAPIVTTLAAMYLG